MPFGQTLADVLGGLVAINKGDPGGAQAFTKQGRSQLAAQRENTHLDTVLQHEAFQAAAKDPQANMYLQKFLQQGLENKQTQAQTQHIGAQTQGVQEQTKGTALENVERQRSNQFFQPYGGRSAAEFGEQQFNNEASRGLQGAQKGLVDQNVASNRYALQSETAKDMYAQFQGFPTYETWRDFMAQTMRQKEMTAHSMSQREANAASMFGHLYPDMSGGVSDSQRQMAGAAGVHLNEDPRQAQQREMAHGVMKALPELLGRKPSGSQQPTQQAPVQQVSPAVPQAGPARPPANSPGQWLDRNVWPSANPQAGPTPVASVLDSLMNFLAPAAKDHPYAQPKLEFNVPQAQQMIQQLLQQQLQGGQQ